jgi:hypothetical protein
MAEGNQGPSLSNTIQDVLEDSEQMPLFAGAKISSLSATLLLLNVCRTYGCSNLFISELLHMLHHSFLREPNTLPTSEYAASRALKRLGLNYECIHVYPNNCMLFRGEEDRDLEECCICGAPRYKEAGVSLVPHKVLRHFPLIPRLQRMFSSPV